MSKHFLQIFDIKGFERVHLNKDVGMIPLSLKNKYGFKSTIAFYDTEFNQDLQTIENGIYLDRIKMNVANKVKVVEFFLSPMVLYLIKNAKKIDYLMLFHIKRQNYLYRLIYKVLNSKGKVYLKLDIDAIGVNGFKEYRKAELQRINLLNIKVYKDLFVLLKKKLGFKLLKSQLAKFDLISVETKEGLVEINKATLNILKDKMILMYNGISSKTLTLEARKEWKDKENIIITVGRIGTKVKNNEMLLRAIERVDLKDWKIYFIGPIDQYFMNTIQEYFENNPNLVTKVFFVGNVSDKSSLYNWYSRSKVFCLTSYSEGFPLVFPEALYYGNYIVSTKVGAERDITNFSEFGQSVDVEDDVQLSYIIQDIIDGKVKISDKYEDIIQYCEDNFVWENIIDNLYNHLEKL